jgi:uncharacterized protein YfaS (alpha-2-macroglobulin family)
LLEELAAQTGSDAAVLNKQRGSLVLVDDPEFNTRDMALVLAVNTASLAKLTPSASQRSAADAAAARLAAVDAPLVQSLLMVSKSVGTERAAALLNQVRADVPTFDRAQTLLWLQRAWGGRPQARSEAAELATPWQRASSLNGEPLWQWPAGASLPNTLSLTGAGKTAWAYLSFESSEPQAPTLPAVVERTLWRVVPQSSSESKKAASAAKGQEAAGAEPSADPGRMRVALERVKPGEALDTTALYLDQVSVKADTRMRWALVEVALPPGAAVESGTWGIDIAEGSKAQPLERAQHQATAQGYAVPIDALSPGNPVVLRHLVRFSQRGQFKLPPTRLQRMYQPEAKAADQSGAWLAMDVR